ncbi:Uncharacterised protein [Chlamydia trachomatis]|nr:Uncharacterised protein [Chlamydia trachomatis]CRH86278.1 Uncharacterised protein [Chlamydia trachomatis]
MAWIIPAIGVLAPHLMLAVVLESEPVTGMPANKEVPMLAIPWPINWQFD